MTISALPRRASSFLTEVESDHVVPNQGEVGSAPFCVAPNFRLPSPETASEAQQLTWAATGAMECHCVTVVNTNLAKVLLLCKGHIWSCQGAESLINTWELRNGRYWKPAGKDVETHGIYKILYFAES